MKPAKAAQLIAIAVVLQSEQTLTVCEGYDEEKLICKMIATMIPINKAV